MSDCYYYVSFQYSAIQKTVLRHERLWSLAGMSRGLAHLNEHVLPETVAKYSGNVLVAGGGKFTVRFPDKEDANMAHWEIMRSVAAAFPMLEFQVSPVVKAPSLRDAKDGLIEPLRQQKEAFRGYGVTFNPHLQVCEECGEYPAFPDPVPMAGGKKKHLCAVCWHAIKNAPRRVAARAETTIERVYESYLREVGFTPDRYPEIPLDFEDLFSERAKENTDEKRQRMAVWFSDVNNMNQRVPIWLDQPDNNIRETFKTLTDLNIKVVAGALKKTFPKPGNVLPFRLVVAGGDDLCIVMDEIFILDFATNLSQEHMEVFSNLPSDNPISRSWLESHTKKTDKPLKDHSFGSSFVVCSINTPFKNIHNIGETLMSKAKEKTGRQHNSINWRVMAEDESATDQVMDFERPLFIEKAHNAFGDKLSFADYMDLRRIYRNLSTSHIHYLVSVIIQSKETNDLERRLYRLAMARGADDYKRILKEDRLKDADGYIVPERLATLLELLSIGGGNGD